MKIHENPDKSVKILEIYKQGKRWLNWTWLFLLMAEKKFIKTMIRLKFTVFQMILFKDGFNKKVCNLVKTAILLKKRYVYSFHPSFQKQRVVKLENRNSLDFVRDFF